MRSCSQAEGYVQRKSEFAIYAVDDSLLPDDAAHEQRAKEKCARTRMLLFLRFSVKISCDVIRFASFCEQAKKFCQHDVLRENNSGR
jgi:hypothetical protein